jgi:sulfotransferase family protein
MVATRSRPRPLIVLGVPRSGTTLIGNYLGSSSAVTNLAEYGGFYVVNSVVPAVIQRIPGYRHDEYLAEIREHARAFAERAACADGRAWYVDHTPWNLEVAARLAADLPDALFVLLLRHYAGNVLSLHRFDWGGDTWADSARLWATLCGHIIDLPADRLIPIGYDALASEPGPTLTGLAEALGRHGFPAGDLDDGVLALSHAAIIGQPRPVIGVADEVAPPGVRPISSFDADRWSGDIHAQVWPVVKDMHHELLRRFPGTYRCPPRPGSLRIHDDATGLIAYELPDW